MRTFTCLIALMCLTLTTLAQEFTQTIKGRVVDQQSKSPVIGATVLIKDSDPLMGGTTDYEGYFRITEVPIGRLTLVFSSVGYESKSIPNVIVGSGKETILEIELIESLTQMEEVVIVADKQAKGQPLDDMASVSAISMSVEETSRYAATFDDPARAALSQAGVSGGGDDLLNEIVIRGNSPKGLLWRLEGVEIPNPNHFAEVGSSAGGISMLSANVLSNSDFFTGAFPAQYGNAYSGIFDLRMRNGNFDKRETTFQAGMLGIQASSEGPFKGESNASYLFNYRYSTLGLFSAIGLDILGEEEAISFQDLSFKLNLPTKKMGTFSVWGLGGINTYTGKYYNFYDFSQDSAYAATYFSQFGYDEDSTALYRSFEKEKQYMGATGVTHTIHLNPNLYIQSVLSVTAQNIQGRYDSMRVRVIETEEMLETAVRFSTYLNQKFNAKNTMRIGLIASRLNFDLYNEEWWRGDGKYTVLLDESGHTYFYQSYVQWQHRLNENVTINTGVHGSWFALNGNTYLEPRIGARWQLNSNSVITTGFGLHSRMESLSLYKSQYELSDGSYVQENKDLGFSRAAHGVIGFERMLRSDLRLKTEAYYQYLFEVPVWASDTVSDPYLLTLSALNEYDGYTAEKLVNEGTGRNYGVEISLEKFFVRDRYFMINGSLYQSRYTGIDGVERNTVFNGNYIFNALGGKEFKYAGGQKILNLNMRFIYSGGKREAPILFQQSQEAGYTVRDYDRNNTAKMNDYWRIDLGASYKVNRQYAASVIALNIQNVFAVTNEYGRYYADGKIYSASQLGFFPNISYRVEF
ncbi:TonB-dependent receptor [Marinoscillum sp. MHG1-6]|uniref:TonB-dependent receptor n=1 Tax=Marinoscillum sp. MHG1-6 TaxID=2959627 RepID=UPI0021586414|nr:TonB-dependent receptor [Marinoscillum sp. MHG1-6]